MTVTETRENRLSYETKSHFLPFYFITNLGIVGYTRFSPGIVILNYLMRKANTTPYDTPSINMISSVCSKSANPF